MLAVWHGMGMLPCWMIGECCSTDLFMVGRGGLPLERMDFYSTNGCVLLNPPHPHSESLCACTRTHTYTGNAKSCWQLSLSISDKV